MDRAGVVILAGGQGLRMGGRKPERLFRGRRLIDPVIDRALMWNVPAVICVRRPGQVSGAALAQILDLPDMEGPLAGLLAAFEWARQEGLDHFLTLPCDTPFLPDDVLPRLLRVCQDTGQAAVAASNGRQHPTCAVWPLAAQPGVAAYAKTGRRSLSGALETCGAVEVAWPESPDDMFLNINTPEDLAALER